MSKQKESKIYEDKTRRANSIRLNTVLARKRLFLRTELIRIKKETEENRDEIIFNRAKFFIGTIISWKDYKNRIIKGKIVAYVIFGENYLNYEVRRFKKDGTEWKTPTYIPSNWRPFIYNRKD